MFKNCKVQLVLGTDSLASNDSLNIWEEIKTIRKNNPEIPLTDMLTWATINGARALEVDHRFGSFEKGKTPGFYHIADVETT
jgi:cytosine/adenosine deaminase-related metal-dependent hydrolase